MFFLLEIFENYRVCLSVNMDGIKWVDSYFFNVGLIRLILKVGVRDMSVSF